MLLKREDCLALQDLRRKINLPTQPVRDQMGVLINHLSLEDKFLVLKNWGELGKFSWVFDLDISEKDLASFTKIVTRLEQHKSCKLIFAFLTSPRLIVMMPGESEDQVLQELKKRVMLL